MDYGGWLSSFGSLNLELLTLHKLTRYCPLCGHVDADRFNFPTPSQKSICVPQRIWRMNPTALHVAEDPQLTPFMGGISLEQGGLRTISCLHQPGVTWSWVVWYVPK